MSNVQHVQAYKKDLRLFRLAGVALYQASIDFLAIAVAQAGLRTGPGSVSAILVCSLLLLLTQMLPSTVLVYLQVIFLIARGTGLARFA